MANTTSRSKVDSLLSYAADGERLVYAADGGGKPSTLWAGMGNRAGLHDAADGITSEKFKKGAERLEKRLVALEPGEVQVQQFRNVTRDRGRWVTVKRFRVGGDPAEQPPKAEECEVCGAEGRYVPSALMNLCRACERA